MRGWRWWMRRVGRVLVATGLLVLLFAAYQLWGTGLQTARAQDQLSTEFDDALAATTTPVTTTPVATTAAPAPTIPGTTIPATTIPSTTIPATAPPTAPPAPPDGDAVARIEIPRIGVNKIVVEGVAVADLRKGPGHYPGTALPGVRGNVAIAGHRTTYGAPFESINELKPGDEIVLTSVTGRYVYRVTGSRIVSPSDTSVLADTGEAILTLTSCHPKYSARQRIIVTAAFDASASSPLLEPTVPGAVPSTAPPTTLATLPGGEATTVAPAIVAPTTVPDSPLVTSSVPAAGTFDQGWVSDPNAWSHLAFWGTTLTLIAVGAWLLGKRIPQWAAVLLAIVPFTVVLYLFFDNVNRLLPPNL